jgi:hypothetical protein
MINDKENVFYQKIDFDNVGIIGHSTSRCHLVSGKQHLPFAQVCLLPERLFVS